MRFDQPTYLFRGQEARLFDAGEHHPGPEWRDAPDTPLDAAAPLVVIANPDAGDDRSRHIFIALTADPQGDHQVVDTTGFQFVAIMPTGPDANFDPADWPWVPLDRAGHGFELSDTDDTVGPNTGPLTGDNAPPSSGAENPGKGPERAPEPPETGAPAETADQSADTGSMTASVTDETAAGDQVEDRAGDDQAGAAADVQDPGPPVSASMLLNADGKGGMGGSIDKYDQLSDDALRAFIKDKTGQSPNAKAARPRLLDLARKYGA